jgi:hypothetical protein
MRKTTRWEVEGTDEFADWYGGLDADEQDDVVAAVTKLEELGPALGRPLVDTIATSRHANMKELRPLGGNMRILFAFDPRRAAILLIGGDKTNRWAEWYRAYIPIADQLYHDHLATLKKEESK